MATRRAYGAAPFNIPGEFAGIDFSPDSRHLWAVLPGDERSQLVSFDVASGRVASQRVLEERLRVLFALPDGSVLAGGWGLIQRINAKGKRSWVLTGPQAYHLAAMNPKRTLFASVEQGEVLIREERNAAVVHTLQEKEGDVYAVAFSADGAWLATGSSKGIVRLYDANTGKERAKRKSTKVLALAFSPSGAHLLVGHGNGAVELWTLPDLKPVRGGVGRHEFEQGGGAGCRWVAFSPDGGRAYSLGNERVLRSWSVPAFNEGPVIQVPDRHMQGSVTALSADGRWLATGSTAGALSVWSTEDGSERTGEAAPSPILGLALTPEAVIATSHRAFVSWAFDSGKRTELPATFAPTDAKGLTSGGLVRLDYDRIFVGKALAAKDHPDFELSSYASGPLAISRDETRLAAPAQENAQVWVLKRGLLQADLPHQDRVRACAFGPKDAWLATADTALRLWRLGKKPELIRDIPLGDEDDASNIHVRGLAVSPRGWIAVSVADADRDDADSVLLVVDPRNGETVSRLERTDAVLGQVAFVGDTRIAVADSLGRLLLVDVANPAKARWLGAEHVEPRPPVLVQDTRPLAMLGDTLAYVGPDGSVVVETLKPAKVSDEAPFLLEPEAAPKDTEGRFEQRFAGTHFFFGGRFRAVSPAFRNGLVKELGGGVAAKPDAKVTHLVLGEGAAASIASGLTAKGAEFAKLSENELLKLLLPTDEEAAAMLRNEVKDSAKRWNSWRKRYREARGTAFSVSLQGIDLSGLDLRRYELLELDFTEARLVGADFSKVDLYDIIFRRADLREANFSGASCGRGVFTQANLRGARFDGAKLGGARFDGADLRDVDFSKAQLHLNDFSGADLTGAKMSSDLKDLKYDAKTRWPKGFKP